MASAVCLERLGCSCGARRRQDEARRRGRGVRWCTAEKQHHPIHLSLPPLGSWLSNYVSLRCMSYRSPSSSSFVFAALDSSAPDNCRSMLRSHVPVATRRGEEIFEKHWRLHAANQDGRQRGELLAPTPFQLPATSAANRVWSRDSVWC